MNKEILPPSTPLKSTKLTKSLAISFAVHAVILGALFSSPLMVGSPLLKFLGKAPLSKLPEISNIDHEAQSGNWLGEFFDFSDKPFQEGGQESRKLDLSILPLPENESRSMLVDSSIETDPLFNAPKFFAMESKLPAIAIPQDFKEDLLLPNQLYTGNDRHVEIAVGHTTYPPAADIETGKELEPVSPEVISATSEPSQIQTLLEVATVATHETVSLLQEKPTIEKRAFAPFSNLEIDEPAPLFQMDGQTIVMDRKILTDPNLPGIGSYGLKVETPTSNLVDNFSYTVTTLANPNGEGYYFSLSLNPNFKSLLSPVKQNFYFIIDKSHSIDKHRYDVFKRSVLKAISSLQEGDNFNIILFDKKSSFFSPQPITYAKGIEKQVESFLDAQKQGGVFKNGDLFQSLDQLVPSSALDEEVNTAIVLTDGQSNASSKKQSAAIQSWVKKNDGKVTIYTAAIGPVKNLLLLDLLSTRSGGTLLHSDTHAAFPRKLVRLVQSLRQPLAKRLMISSFKTDSLASVEILSKPDDLQVLRTNAPLEVIGFTDKLDDFTLLIQGKHRNKWFNLQQRVSLKNSGSGDSRKLVKLIKNHKTKEQYNKFLTESETCSLEELEKQLHSDQMKLY